MESNGQAIDAMFLSAWIIWGEGSKLWHIESDRPTATLFFDPDLHFLSSSRVAWRVERIYGKSDSRPAFSGSPSAAGGFDPEFSKLSFLPELAYPESAMGRRRELRQPDQYPPKGES